MSQQTKQEVVARLQCSHAGAEATFAVSPAKP